MTEDEKNRKALRSMLEECIDSLEYVNSSHPGTGGYGVRYDRIARAKKLLEETK